jgi:hypothetical protein
MLEATNIPTIVLVDSGLLLVLLTYYLFIPVSLSINYVLFDFNEVSGFATWKIRVYFA